MKKILVVVLFLIIGGGVYLYTDKDMQKKALNEVDEITKKVDNITKKINKASEDLTFKKPVPVRLNRNVEINIKREAPKAEAEAIINLLNDKNDEKFVDEKNILKEVDNVKKIEKTLKNNENQQKYKPSPYISSVKGIAKISLNQPDRVLINGKIIRFYGIKIINYKHAEQNLIKIVENRLVNCGIINYSQNNIPYGVCFLVDEYNNSKLNINYYLVEQNLAQYVNN